jgi:hypothetical protein
MILNNEKLEIDFKEVDKIDKEKIEVDGLSVYIEKFDKYPEVDFNRTGFNAIQDICITSILQKKDLLCRSVIISKDSNSKIDQRLLTWIFPLISLILSKSKILIIVHRDLCEIIKKEIFMHIKKRDPLAYPKIVTVFSKQEDNLEDLDVLITTPTHGNQLLLKKKIKDFDLLLIDECLKFNESNYFKNVYEIRRFLDFKSQVVVFSTTFSKDNFENIQNKERVVVEVESLGEIKNNVIDDFNFKDILSNFQLKGSWRNDLEKDKILIIVKEYEKLENQLQKERFPFKTLNFKGKKGDHITKEEIFFRDGVLDGFRNGTFPILLVNRFNTRNLNISGLSLVLSLDSVDNIRDYLFRSTLLKKNGKMMTLVSEENSYGFLEDLICTLEVNKVEVPDFIHKLKQEKKQNKKPLKRNKNLNEELEKMSITEDKDLSEDEELNVWG